MTLDLFAPDTLPRLPAQRLGPGAVVLRDWAVPQAEALWRLVQAVVAQAPWRQMATPGGRQMQVASTNCGALGWTSDHRGYRYQASDPLSGQPWPELPPRLVDLAAAAAADAGFPGFEADACLVNRYQPGTRLSLHQDRDEQDFSAPIVSVSLGLPAVFLWGGAARTDRVARVPLQHGDVVVWGGPDRLRFHGVAPLRPGLHPLLGEQRVNLTLRRAG